MESNLQTKKDMVCRLCASKMDVLHDYEGGSSIISSILKGRVCESCREFAEYTPGYGSSKEPLLTKEEHESITEHVVMGLHRKQLCRILPEIKLKGKKLEEQDSTGEKPSSGNLNSKDEDEFDSDDSFEEIYIPTVQGWFKLLTSNQLETNGDEAILALVAQVKELEMSQPSFYIYTDGFYSIEDRSSRQGAVLRDFHNRPIAAWSRIDSDVESISRPHNELEGLSLGLEMAIKYQVTNFYIYCPSTLILSMLRRCICSCSEEKSYTCRKCYLPFVWNKEETFQLLLQIYPLIKQLNLPPYYLRFIDGEDNKAAHWMAELGENRKMDLSEIKKHESLSKILYTDVFGCFDL